jgi:RimJ/RimL family protein N-acetyltransferase
LQHLVGNGCAVPDISWRAIALEFSPRMPVLETERLTLRHSTLDDAAFVLRLLNEPSFLRFIGDRGVRTLGDASRYIADRFIASYEQHGFGLLVVERKEAPGAIGLSGLVKRDALPDPDIGFAFLPEFWSHGFAYESAAGVKRYALETLGLPRLLAITNPDNAGSIRIVEKLGLEFVRVMALSESDEVRLYALDTNAD